MSTNTPQQLQITVDPKESKGVYSNYMEIKHTPEEFCLDFYSLFAPIGSLSARIIISPGHLKRMISALTENLKVYEAQVRPINEAASPEKPTIGFKTRD